MDEHRVTGTARTSAGRLKKGSAPDCRGREVPVQDRRNRFRAPPKPLRSGDAGGDFTDIVRNTIETRPYTAVAIAVGLGWLLGRTHKPL